MKIYGVISTKGGCGKTTTSYNLAAILADCGQRTLLTDADPSGSVSQFVRVTERAPSGLSQVYRTATAEGCISKTNIKNLDVIVNDDNSSDSEVANFLRQSITHYHHLKIALQELEDDYDYVIIDTQGSTGLIQESVIFACDIILTPIKPAILDLRDLQSTFLTMVKKFIPKKGIPSITGRPMPPVKVLISMLDRSTSSKDISKWLRTEFGKELDGIVTVVLNTTIPQLEPYRTAALEQTPVHRYETKRKGATLPASETMLELLHELEPVLADRTPEWEEV